MNVWNVRALVASTFAGLDLRLWMTKWLSFAVVGGGRYDNARMWCDWLIGETWMTANLADIGDCVWTRMRNGRILLIGHVPTRMETACWLCHLGIERVKCIHPSKTPAGLGALHKIIIIVTVMIDNLSSLWHVRDGYDVDDKFITFSRLLTASTVLHCALTVRTWLTSWSVNRHLSI